MELMRQSWTDERLDDLKEEVVRQGGRIDKLSGRIDALSERIDTQTDRLANRIDAQSERIDGLEQTILAIGGRLFASSIAITVAILGLAATQL